MVKILLNGCNGRMGQVISSLAKENDTVTIAAGVDMMPNRFENEYAAYTTLNQVEETVDVVIDFSNPKGLPILLAYCIKKNLPVVICTTGLTPEDRNNIKSASEKIPVLTSANMSVGVNLIMHLVKIAARALEDSFDIEIIEKHHNQKVDSPSGTAIAIAESINSALLNPKEYVYGRHSKTGKRTTEEMGMHAIRGGSIVGDHTVIFAGSGEVVEITHSAISRDVFGVGALTAAKFLYNRKPGLYNMDNVISGK